MTISRSNGTSVRYTHLELVIDHEEFFESDKEAVALFQSTRMHTFPQETFWVLGYGPALNVATLFEVNRGMYAYVDLHIPSMMSGLLLAGCERFWLAHNHSGNNPEPTGGDFKLTKAVMAAANALNMHFEDHVILTPDGNFYSMEHAGILVRDPESPYPAARAAQKKR